MQRNSPVRSAPRLLSVLSLAWFLLPQSAPAQPEKAPPVAEGRFASSTPIAPDGKTAAVRGKDDARVLQLFDPLTGEAVRSLRAHIEGVDEIQFSPDGKTLLSWSHWGEAILWEVATGKPRLTLKAKQRAFHWYAATFSADGKLLAADSLAVAGGAAAEPGVVTWWDAHTGERKGSVLANRGRPLDEVAFFPDGETLMTRGESAGRNPWPGVSFWQLPGGKLKGTLQLHRYGFALAPDGRTAALEGEERNVVELRSVKASAARELGAETVMHRLKRHLYRAYRFRFAPDGKTLVTIGQADRRKGDIVLPIFETKAWDVKTGELIWELGEKESGDAVLWSPDSKTLVVAGRLRDARTGRVERTLPRTGGPVIFSPGGELRVGKFPDAKPNHR